MWHKEDTEFKNQNGLGIVKFLVALLAVSMVGLALTSGLQYVRSTELEKRITEIEQVSQQSIGVSRKKSSG